MDSPGSNRLFAFTWLAAGLTAVAVTAVPGFPDAWRLWAFALGGLTVAVGCVLYLWRRPLTGRAVLLLELGSQGLVTMFGAASGPFEVTTGLMTIGYAFGCVFAAYHLPWRAAALHLAVTAGLYATLLALTTPAAVALPRWLTSTAFLVTLVVVVGRLRDRVQGLLQAMQAESRTDVLTGVLNRRGFFEQAQTELARATRADEPLALLALDVDHFKRLNDLHGHAGGDVALAQLGALLRQHCRACDVAGRLGGEEFALLLPGATTTAAVAAAERLRRAAGSLPGPHRLTISVGVAVLDPAEPADLDALLRVADASLYSAKHLGRDRVVLAATS